ncbi:MAG TPA: DUF1116 domain-containing protein [Rhodospirillales bacterium]|nr:DUF1116 domain-containing protein [Rhodospirillales bacterium]
MGNTNTGRALATLINNEEVDAANRIALSRYLAANPVLKGVDKAANSVPGMGERTLLHAGPPISWEEMGGPMKGAIIGAVIYEGWTETEKAAFELASSGEITFAPCHHHSAVGPMSGIISPSMPVWIVENTEHGNKSYSNFNEGLGKVLRYGANSPEVILRLKWIEETLATVCRSSLENRGELELKPLIGQALHMGDECHNRNVASTALLIKKLFPSIIKTNLPPDDIASTVEFMSGNDLFFLNLSMAACKSMMDAAHGIDNSSMVTAMARNGVTFGIRMSGTGNEWFWTQSRVADGLFFPGFSQNDAAPDLGDSAITETAGIGGFAMASAPAIVQFVGGTPTEALGYTQEMAHITLGRNNAFSIPALDFIGSPAGIDARKVVDTGIEPIINTGIAHKDAGVGQIGAGITRAPMTVFNDAILALADKLGTT